MTSRKHFLIGVGLLTLAQVMVGINIVACKYLLTSISAMSLLFVRFSLASVVLLPFHWISRPQQSVYASFQALSLTDWWYLFAQALTAGVLFNFLMITGLRYTDANVAGIITSALPAIITLLSCVLLNEALTAKKSLCLGLASVGLFVIAYDKLDTMGPHHSFFGDAIVLLALLPEALYYILCKLHTVKLPLFIVSSAFNAINACITFIMLVLTHPTVPDLSVSISLVLFMLGVTSAIFFVFFFLGSQRVDGLMASLSTAVMPVATVLLAWMILGEQLSITQMVGMSLVIISIVVYAKR